MKSNPLGISNLIGSGIITLIGGIVVIVAAYFAVDSYFLLHRGKHAAAAVAKVEEFRGSKGKKSYRSTVEFHTEDGRAIQFTAKEKLFVGEHVDVLYYPAAPEDAQVNDFNSLWGASVIMGGIGSLFFALGLYALYATLKRRKEVQWLLNHGERVRARVVGINEKVTHHRRKHGSRRVTTYQVVCNWTAPRSGETIQLKSESLSIRPGDHIIGTDIEALIDPNNPSVHYIDI